MSVSIQTVAEDEADLRLDRWFRRHFPHITQAAMQKLCRTGQVRVDGGRVDGATRLLAGQAVRVPPLPAGPAPKPVPVVDERTVRELERMVIYRDDHVIVLDKPWGLPVQGGPGITRHLDGMLHALAGDGGKPKLVHRLDRDTSGVLILARGAAAAAKLAAAFRTRHVRKTYWAVVHGRPSPQEEEKKMHVDGLAMKLHLHARSLSLPHPAGGTLDVAAPLPPHMRDSFRLLGFTAPPTPEPRLHRGRPE